MGSYQHQVFEDCCGDCFDSSRPCFVGQILHSQRCARCTIEGRDTWRTCPPLRCGKVLVCSEYFWRIASANLCESDLWLTITSFCEGRSTEHMNYMLTSAPVVRPRSKSVASQFTGIFAADPKGCLSQICFINSSLTCSIIVRIANQN